MGCTEAVALDVRTPGIHTSKRQARRLRSQEAVENQREIRKIRGRIKLTRHERRSQRETRERDIARRMVQRFYHRETVYQIVLSYPYWQARKCGWDACRAEFRSQGEGMPLLEPEETPLWRWWVGLHHENRRQLVEMSTLRVLR